jgi:cytochrome c biogenesis protein CcdA
MNKIKLIAGIVVVCAAISLPLFASAQSITYYYGIGCPYCVNVEPFLETFEQEHPDVTITKKEVYQNQDNAKELLEIFQQFNVPQNQQGVPFIVVGNQYLSGDQPIIQNLEQLVSSAQQQPTEQDAKPSATLSFIAITAAALVDAINPCAITVLVLLLSALLLAGDRKRALKGGLAFTFAIYIAYFLFGVGIVYTIALSGLSLWIYKAVGILAILIGLANLKDFFWYGKGFVMEIPRRWRPTLQKMLHGITSPLGAFLIGFVVTLFELPCTGGPYFFVLGLLSQDIAWTTTIPLLLYYNIIFVLPLIILTLLISWGRTSPERIAQWKNKNIKLLHLIMGIIMVALGVWVLLS